MFPLFIRQQEKKKSSEVLIGVIHELLGELERFNYRLLVTTDLKRASLTDKGVKSCSRGCGFPLQSHRSPGRAARCGRAASRDSNTDTLSQELQLHHTSEDGGFRKTGLSNDIRNTCASGRACVSVCICMCVLLGKNAHSAFPAVFWYPLIMIFQRNGGHQ